MCFQMFQIMVLRYKKNIFTSHVIIEQKDRFNYSTVSANTYTKNILKLRGAVV